MYKFSESTIEDIPQLTEWIKSDPYHKDCLSPLWWLTGSGLLSFRMDDRDGSTMYVRTEPDNKLLRIHTQFAPESVVSKIRVIKTIMWGLPKMESIAVANGLDGLIYRSTNPELIRFMQKKFGFISVGDDDYRMLFRG